MDDRRNGAISWAADRWTVRSSDTNESSEQSNMVDAVREEARGEATRVILPFLAEEDTIDRGRVHRMVEHGDNPNLSLVETGTVTCLKLLIVGGLGVSPIKTLRFGKSGVDPRSSLNGRGGSRLDARADAKEACGPHYQL